MATNDNRLSVGDLVQLKHLSHGDSRFDFNMNPIRTNENWVRAIAELNLAQAEADKANRKLRLTEEIMMEVAKKFFPEKMIAEAKFSMFSMPE